MGGVRSARSIGPAGAAPRGSASWRCVSRRRDASAGDCRSNTVIREDSHSGSMGRPSIAICGRASDPSSTMAGSAGVAPVTGTDSRDIDAGSAVHAVEASTHRGSVTHERMAPVRLVRQRDWQPGRGRGDAAQDRLVATIEDRDGRLTTRGQPRRWAVDAGVAVVRANGDGRQQLTPGDDVALSCQVMSMPGGRCGRRHRGRCEPTMPIAVLAGVSRATPSRARAVNPAGPAHEIAPGAIASAINWFARMSWITAASDGRSGRSITRWPSCCTRATIGPIAKTSRPDATHAARSARLRAPSWLPPGEAGA